MLQVRTVHTDIQQMAGQQRTGQQMGQPAAGYGSLCFKIDRNKDQKTNCRNKFVTGARTNTGQLANKDDRDSVQGGTCFGCFPLCRKNSAD
jgi:hypothetical protein